MKNSYLLPAMIILSSIAGLNAMQQNRPATYQMIDVLMAKGNNDWPAVFAVLDEMRGVINVNEYRYGVRGMTLICEAVLRHNLLAAKTLLEKYKANPNILSSSHFTNSSAINIVPLMDACYSGDIPMIKLLLLHEADPNLKDSLNRDDFHKDDSFGYVGHGYAKNKAEILKLLESFRK